MASTSGRCIQTWYANTCSPRARQVLAVNAASFTLAAAARQRQLRTLKSAFGCPSTTATQAFEEIIATAGDIYRTPSGQPRASELVVLDSSETSIEPVSFSKDHYDTQEGWTRIDFVL